MTDMLPIVVGIALLGSPLSGSPQEAGSESLRLDRADTEPSRVEDAEAYVVAGASASLAGASPFASILISRNSRSPTIISFHRVQVRRANERFDYVWMARMRTAVFLAVTTRYADGRNCPAIDQALITLEQIERPVLDFPGVPVAIEAPLQVDSITMDDYTFSLNARGTFPLSRSYAELTMSGDSASPVGAWARMVEAALTPCWTAGAPV
ncbi:MAG: hypothetical protein M3Q74_05970 [Pseudomonadota bacterium]|nr:hypothetical protein [Pseudomonadota bacterium]